jgi:hypothetical protein
MHTFGKTMSRILTIGCLLILASCASVQRPEMAQWHDHPDAALVKQTLAAITIPEANLRQVTTDCAITFWVSETQENDPQHRGVSTIYQDGRESHPMVDIVGTHVSALDLLNKICHQANLVWWLTPQCLMIRPQNERGAEQPAAPLQSEGAPSD